MEEVKKEVKKATPEQKKRTGNSVTGKPLDKIDTKPQLDSVTEQAGKAVVLTYGRMNPPTIGHEKLINKVKQHAKEHNADHLIVASHSQDAKKNPLTADQKLHHLHRAFPGTNIQTSNKEHPSFIHQLKKLSGKYDHVHLVVGSDRVPEFEKVANKYNGKEYHFKKIHVVSAGHRDPDAEGTEGMSASKMRDHVKNNDYNSFKKGIPSKMSDSHSKRMFHDIRSGMGLHENAHEYNEETQLNELSPATLGSYAKKSSKQATGLVKKIGDINNKKYTGRSNYQPLNKLSGEDEAEKSRALAKLKQRKQGQALAVKKLDKMGEEVNESTDPDYHAKVHQDLQWHAGRNRGRSMGAANYHHLMTKDDQSHIEKHYEKTILPILKKHRYPTPPKGPGDGGNQKYHAAVKEIIKNWEKEPRINESTSSASFMLNMTRKEEVEQIDEKKALTVQQRQQRARQMRVQEPKLERKRELAKRKVAGKEQLQRRAMGAAREIVKKRFSAKKGVRYQELTTSEKMAVDRAVETKTGLIKKIASRLMPKIRQAEFARFKSFTGGAAMKSMHSVPATIAASYEPSLIDQLFEQFLSKEQSRSLQTAITEADAPDQTNLDILLRIGLADIEQLQMFRKAMKNPEKSVKDPLLRGKLVAVLNKIMDIVTKDPSIFAKTRMKIQQKEQKALFKKSQITGLPLAMIEEVYTRGYENPHSGMSPEQSGFARVNSFIAGGAALQQDDDLLEGLKDPEDNPCWKGYKPVGTKKKAGKTVPNCVPEETKIEGTNCKNCVWWGKDDVRPVGKDELNENGGIKPYSENYAKMSKEVDLVTLPGKATVSEKAICEHKKIMDWVTERMCCALWDGEGTKREYKGQSPVMESINENFNIQFASGVGVTLTAADLGMKAKSGFQLHPSVVEEEHPNCGTPECCGQCEVDEEVRSADVKGTVVHTASGKTVVRRQKANRKIIGTGNLTDGKPDDTV